MVYLNTRMLFLVVLVACLTDISTQAGLLTGPSRTPRPSSNELGERMIAMSNERLMGERWSAQQLPALLSATATATHYCCCKLAWLTGNH